MFSLRRLVTATACAAICLLNSSAMAAYNIGIGKSDITGPAAEVVMMGYADSTQKSAGLLNRLYARAFIMEDADTEDRLVFVNCDLLAVFQLVQQEVIKQLKTKYDGLYTEQNVVLHAVHTHSGPGGSSAYFLYDVSIFGFINENYEKIVAGILSAIDAAHENVSPGTIHFSKGQIPNAGKNRSPPAYLANPEAERALYPADHDLDMRALQFRGPDGKLRGVLAWFPVHPTSLTQKNKLISSDNKGYAEFLAEEKYPGAIVGIGISNAGDVSPNLIDNANGTFRGEGKDDIESAEIIGGRQASKLFELVEGKTEEIKGTLVGNLSYVDYSNVTIAGAVATPEDPYAGRTCPAMVGQNFGAGTEDGRGLGQFTEGDLKPNPLFKAIGAVLKDAPQWVKDCHTKNKVQLLAVGLNNPVPWAPNVLPLQVLKIGQFGLAITNFEVTTMSGRRIRTTMKEALAPAGVTEVELVSISNAYAQYLTTPEEYATQNYEGASTLFGPNQLAAVRQELARVAKSVVDPSVPLDVGPTPRQFDPSKLMTVQTGVVLDTAGWGKKFGDLREDARESYTVGETVAVEFRGGHPKNHLELVNSFCDVDKQDAGGNWTTLLTDAHWDVRFEWHRAGMTESRSVCKWYVRQGNPSSVAGRYRIRHRGYWKSLFGDLKEYEGSSSAFSIK